VPLELHTMVSIEPIAERNESAISRPTRSRPSGRAEFTRIYLRSLTSSVEREIDAYRASRRPLRLALAERRLRKLHGVSAARGLRPEETERRRPRVAFAVATVALLCSASLLVPTIATGGFVGTALALEEIAMLVLVVIWFGLAIACVPKSSETAPLAGSDPESEQSASGPAGAVPRSSCDSLSPESSRLLEAWLQGME
jgi:hypothetical protein